eukprot:2359649-Pleurochrysis_carterae.AAC.6
MTTREKHVCKLKTLLLERGRRTKADISGSNKGYGFTQFRGKTCISSLSSLMAPSFSSSSGSMTSPLSTPTRTNVSSNGFRQQTANASKTRSLLVSTSSSVSGWRAIAMHARTRYRRSYTSRRLLTASYHARRSASRPLRLLGSPTRHSVQALLVRLASQRPSLTAIKQSKPYIKLVASILYSATMTRPVLSYHTSMLKRFMHTRPVDCYCRAEELLNYLYSITKGQLT